MASVTRLPQPADTPRQRSPRKGALCYGVGMNDVDFPVYQRSNGKSQPIDPFKRWKLMLRRCYSAKLHKDRPSYAGCKVVKAWLCFSGFYDWYVDQHKEAGWHLDKDLLVPGNKVYSPDACIFVPPELNYFTNERPLSKGSGSTGTYSHSDCSTIEARCNNPFTGKREYLGRFKSDEEAHLAWRERKHELSCQWADRAHDARLAEALRKRYLPSGKRGHGGAE